ncbi:Histone deacetylase 2, partial [Perkinsus olseni]
RIINFPMPAVWQIPMIVLGGGGYTLRNVPRCWAYETCRLAGVDPPDELPEDSQYAHFYKMSDHDPLTLDVRISNMLDRNTSTQLHSVVETITDNCREYLGRGSPSS